MMKKSDTIPDQNLDDIEQAIENAPAPPKGRLSDERKREIESAQTDALKDRTWGGPRPGAGRPSVEVKKRNISLTPEADAALLRLQKKKGMKLGAAVSWAILEAEKTR